MKKQKSYNIFNLPAERNSSRTPYLILLFSLLILLQKQATAAKPVNNKQLIVPPFLPNFLAHGVDFITKTPIISAELSTQHIFVDDRISKIASVEAISQARTSCEIAIAEILEENSWLPKGQLIMDLQNRNLIIVLIPESAAVNEASNGLYSTLDGQLGIVYKSWANISHYKMVCLKNWFRI